MMPMKYILQLPGRLSIGGAERVAADIGLFATVCGYETHYVVFGEQQGEYEQELTEHGCRIMHWPEPSCSYPRFFGNLRRLMKQYPYAAVHAHTMFNSGWAMLAARLAGVPVRITHAHSALVNGSSVRKQTYESIMRQMILRNATELVACGDAAGVRLYGEKTYRERGLRILNGIDVDRFAFSEDARQRIRSELKTEQDFVIGHVGHMARVKNQAFLIRLLPRILEKRPNAKLLLLGDGQDRDMLEGLVCENGLADRVIMTGNVRNVQDYLSAMDVFAFPSLFEGMPLSIVEAQANGLPCVLSTGVPNDVNLTDLLTPLSLDEPDRWAEAICAAGRVEPERYADEIRRCGLDTASVLEKYAEIYERADRNG